MSYATVAAKSPEPSSTATSTSPAASSATAATGPMQQQEAESRSGPVSGGLLGQKLEKLRSEGIEVVMDYGPSPRNEARGGETDMQVDPQNKPVDLESVNDISDQSLRKLVQRSNLISEQEKAHLLHLDDASLRREVAGGARLSQLEEYLDGVRIFSVPVYVIYGQHEDVRVIEKFVNGTYRIPNLHLIHETQSGRIPIDEHGTMLRIFGVGGAIIEDKLFDHGEARRPQAGGDGKAWATMLQIGHMIRDADGDGERSDKEIRMFVTSGSPVHKVAAAQIALRIQADILIGIGTSPWCPLIYNHKLLQTGDTFSARCMESERLFFKLFSKVRQDLEAHASDTQKRLLQLAASAWSCVPRSEDGYANLLFFTLPDVSSGQVRLDFRDEQFGHQVFASGCSLPSRKPRSSQPASTQSSPRPSAKPSWQSSSATVYVQPPTPGTTTPGIATPGTVTPPLAQNHRGLLPSRSLDSLASFRHDSGIATAASQSAAPSRASNASMPEWENASPIIVRPENHGVVSAPNGGAVGQMHNPLARRHSVQQLSAWEEANGVGAGAGMGGPKVSNWETPVVPGVSDGMVKLGWDSRSAASDDIDAPTLGMTLWVGNLPDALTEDDLRLFFRAVPVLRVKIHDNRPDRRPCAYVDVPDQAALDKALKLSGERLLGSRLKVEYNPSKLKMRDAELREAEKEAHRRACDAALMGGPNYDIQSRPRSASFSLGTRSSGASPIMELPPNGWPQPTPQPPSNVKPQDVSGAAPLAPVPVPIPASNGWSNNNNAAATQPNAPQAKETSWDSPPTKGTTSFSTGLAWDKPGHKQESAVVSVGWGGTRPAAPQPSVSGSTGVKEVPPASMGGVGGVGGMVGANGRRWSVTEGLEGQHMQNTQSWDQHAQRTNGGVGNGPGWAADGNSLGLGGMTGAAAVPTWSQGSTGAGGGALVDNGDVSGRWNGNGRAGSVPSMKPEVSPNLIRRASQTWASSPIPSTVWSPTTVDASSGMVGPNNWNGSPVIGNSNTWKNGTGSVAPAQPTWQAPMAGGANNGPAAVPGPSNVWGPPTGNSLRRPKSMGNLSTVSAGVGAGWNNNPRFPNPYGHKQSAGWSAVQSNEIGGAAAGWDASVPKGVSLMEIDAPNPATTNNKPFGNGGMVGAPSWGPADNGFHATAGGPWAQQQQHPNWRGN
ncbi:hypothetical protein HK104_006594 [Borealophlyctis nickersoniae]|nr:hypothetical protein HK104_006594 [Borealophlyctis nickersoniae]